MKKAIVALLLLLGSCSAQTGNILTFGFTNAGTSAASTPVFTPSNPRFYLGGNTSVSLSCSTPGCYICYTTNGTTPVPNVVGGCSTGTLYSGAFMQSTVGTLYAVSGASGYFSSAMASATVAQSSLVAQWKQLDGTGSTSTDSCCGVNLALANGTWTGAVAPLSNMVLFNGTSTTETASSVANVNFNYNQPFSVAAYVYIATAPGNAAIIAHTDAANNYRGWDLLLAWDGNAHFAVAFELFSTYPSNWLSILAGTGVAGNFGNIPPNTMACVVSTYDGTTTTSGVKVYVNGSPVAGYAATASSLTSTTTNSLPPTLGERPDGTDRFPGKIGPVNVWNRVLTSTEAASWCSSPYTTID